MTIRKLAIIYDEYCSFHNIGRKQEENDIDDIFPDAI